MRHIRGTGEAGDTVRRVISEPATADEASSTPGCGPPPQPLGLRERKKAQTREAILDAAISLFERNGYDNTTVEEIAAEANVSPRTFFRYFDTKLETIMESSDAEVDDIQQMVRDRPADEKPLEAVRQVAQQKLVAEVVREGSNLAREMRVIMATPSLEASAHEHIREHEASLVPAVAERLGVTTDAVVPHLIAAVATTTMWKVFQMWVAEGGDPDRLSPLLDEAFAVLTDLG